MDRVPDGIQSMLKDLEEHIITAGLDDMKQAAEIITQVCKMTSPLLLCCIDNDNRRVCICRSRYLKSVDNVI